MRVRDLKTQTSRGACALSLVLAAVACSTPAPPPPAMPPASAPVAAPVQTPAREAAQPLPRESAARAAPSTSTEARPNVAFRAGAWSDLPGWRDDRIDEAWPAFLASCASLGGREPWRAACNAAARVSNPAPEVARLFFEQWFTPWLVTSGDGVEEGLITGYYEPLLRGSRKPSARYRYPLYGVPDDLVVIELADVHPELKGMRLRGKIEGRRVVPYYDRAQIENGQAPVRGKELAWVDDPVELFFLHVQGSGRIALDDGQTMRVGYADHNGHAYRSIGRVLVERGDLALEHASMQGIKEWARANPTKLRQLLHSNSSYVFFRELPAGGKGPPGAFGVPLTPGRSIAVDARFVPLGAPVYMAATWPNNAKPLNRLTLAQDTGGAIRGAVRADFFWGYGEPAAREAGRMKQRLRMWLLFPRGHTPDPSGGLGQRAAGSPP